MTKEQLVELETAAHRYHAIPSPAVLQLLAYLGAVLADRDATRAQLADVQASLVRIIQQLQDCRDTEAAVLRLVSDAQDRKVEV